MSEILKKLGEVLEDRKTKASSESYVSSLYDKGIGEICDKVDEESKELIIALKTESNDRIVGLGEHIPGFLSQSFSDRLAS